MNSDYDRLAATKVPILTTKQHLNSLRRWKVSNIVKEKIKRTCFGSFLEIHEFQNEIRQDWQVLSAFLPFYNVGDSSFCVGQGYKLLLGLLDIFYITGLPIDGKPLVNPVKETDETARQLAVEHLGCPLELLDSLLDHRRINLNVLKQHYEVVPLEVESLEPYIKGYLLYMFGKTIFSGKDNFKVSVSYLRFLSLEDIDSFAWGAAVLTHLQCAIKAQVANNQPTLSGFTTALLVFVLEHFPGIAEKIMGKPIAIPRRIPLYLEWMKALEVPKRDKRNTKRAEYYFDCFKDLDESQILYEPYKQHFGLNYKELSPTILSHVRLDVLDKHWDHHPEIAFK